MIRILIAEDQAMMRGALALLLGLEPDLEVVAQVGTAPGIVPAALAAEPDVALLDIELPGGNGLDETRALRAALPSCAVVVVTTFGRPGYLRRAMDAGARGFLVKDGPVEGLAEPSGASSRAGRSSTPTSPRAPSPPAPTRSPTASARSSPPPRTARPSATSPAACTCPTARSATTCRARSARPAPATASRPSAPRAAPAGSDRPRRPV